MKRYQRLLALAVMLLLVTTCVTVSAETPIRVLLHGKEIAFDVPPQIINSRTMVPLRAIFEALGASVEWDGKTRTVTSVKEDVTIQLTIEDATMHVNDTTVTLDTPACIVDSRTLVPVRAISEAFGILVEWFGDQQTVALGSIDGIYENPMFYNGLCRVMKDQKYGYVNPSGEEVIALQFDYALDFYDGHALVKTDGNWYSIDTTGNIVSTIQDVSIVSTVSEGLATVLIGEKWGYINTKGELVIAPEYEIAGDFHEGLAAVAIKKEISGLQFGYIDTNGTMVIPALFENADRFYEGFAAVKESGKWSYVDKKGSLIIAPKYTDCQRFSNGLAAVEVNGKWGYINTRGKLVITPEFEYAHSFSDGMASYLKNGSYHFLSEKTKLPLTFYQVGDFSYGLAPVSTGSYGATQGTWGYLNKDAKLQIPTQFDDAYPFSNGLAAVLTDGTWGFIDPTGEYVIPPRFEGILQDFTDDGYAICKNTDKEEFIIDKTGTVLTEAYDDIPRNQNH